MSALLPASPSISGTANELFNIWLNKCQSRQSTKGATQLEQESRSFFQSLAQGVSIVSSKSANNEQKVLQTKSSHQAALATLLQTFQPLWTGKSASNISNGTLLSRYHALHAITGALQGCGELSLPTISLLGNFLLPHIGPLDVSDKVELMDDGIPTRNLEIGNNFEDHDLDEQVRDIALKVMTSLISCTVTQLQKEQDSNDASCSIDDIIDTRIRFTRSSLEHRCTSATNQDRMDTTNGFEQDEQHVNITQGLSTLPRARRSLCFDLIQSAVKAVGQDSQSTNAVITDVSAVLGFVKFVPNLLHGESDPRCLLQLLTLFADLLQIWQPIFVNHKISSNDIFIGDYFDAIAPYYPIQFSPPPNNIHGITKKHLQKAIFRIMSSTYYDDAANKRGQDGMLVLSVGLILDTILPLPEDGPATFSEQRDGLDDLARILLNNGSDSDMKGLDKLDEQTLRNVSNTLYTLHNQSSLIVAINQNTEEATYAKDVADTCRDLVARLALACEISRNRATWKVFVAEHLQSLSAHLSSTATSSAESRTAMAYIACLCACGGSRTLQLCLDKGLSPLLDQLLKGMQDDSDLASAIFGIGALFSSTRVALKKMDIVVHPHPLEAYTSTAMDKLCSVFSVDSVLPVRVAAAQAIESLLLAAPACQFGPDQIVKLRHFVHAVTDELLEDGGDKEPNLDDNRWLQNCADIIGRMLGKVFAESANEVNGASLFQDNDIRSYFKDQIFVSLLSSVSRCRTSRMRYDRKALALASVQSETIAKEIAQVLLQLLSSDDVQHIDNGRLEAVKYFSLRSGPGVSKALQCDEGGSDFLLKFIDKISSFQEKKVIANTQTSLRVSTLELPPSPEDIEVFDNRLKATHSIVPLLTPLYKQHVSTSHLVTLIRRVTDIMPPLNASDTFKVSVVLPFLASALFYSKDDNLGGSSEMIDQCATSMLPDLLDFAITTSLDTTTQQTAVECLHTLLSYYMKPAKECPVFNILRNVLFPSFKQLLHEIEQDKLNEETKKSRKKSNLDLAKLENEILDRLTLCGLLTSASVFRNTIISSQTADVLAAFLVDLACCSKADDVISDNAGPVIDLEVLDRPGRTMSRVCNAAASSAFGSVLTAYGGNALWKQRLVFMAFRRMKAGDTQLHPGSLSIMCYIVCACELTTIGGQELAYLVDFIVQGFSSTALLHIDTLIANNEMEKSTSTELKQLLLAAALKLLSAKVETFAMHLYRIVIGTLRLYASLSTVEPSAIACKLLALQILTVASRVDNCKEVVQTLQPAIVSILGAAVNDQNLIIRSAAVEVRNTWYIIAQ